MISAVLHASLMPFFSPNLPDPQNTLKWTVHTDIHIYVHEERKEANKGKRGWGFGVGVRGCQMANTDRSL